MSVKQATESARKEKYKQKIRLARLVFTMSEKYIYMLVVNGQAAGHSRWPFTQ